MIKPETRKNLAALSLTKRQEDFRITHRGRPLLITKDYNEAKTFFGRKIQGIKNDKA